MSQERNSMLASLMELDFALVETSHYLSNHPLDKKALKLHNIIVEKFENLENTYESKFGQLTYKQSKL